MVKLNSNFLATSIGTKFAPPYACIFIVKVETELLSQTFWYIDDFFFIWSHGEEKLLKDLNKKDLIKFTHEANKECITFLGLKVKLLDGGISTDLFVKSTDRYQFLYYTSSHPELTKHSTVFSQALKISRICSYESDFVRHLGNKKSWFRKKDTLQFWLRAKRKKLSLLLMLTIRTQVNLIKGPHLYWLITLKKLIE